MGEYKVFLCEDQMFYSEGVISDNGEYQTIKLNNGKEKWAVVMPYDLCELACSEIGKIYVEN